MNTLALCVCSEVNAYKILQAHHAPVGGQVAFHTFPICHHLLSIIYSLLVLPPMHSVPPVDQNNLPSEPDTENSRSKREWHSASTQSASTPGLGVFDERTA